MYLYISHAYCSYATPNYQVKYKITVLIIEQEGGSKGRKREKEESEDG